MKKLFAMVLAATMGLALLSSCGAATTTASSKASSAASAASTETSDAEWATVRVGIHSNGPGSALFAVALKNGYFDEEHIKTEYTIVSGGGAEMAAMRADSRTLDIGFIGTGVAWNAMDAAGKQLSFVFTDSNSNNENLIVAPEVGLTADSTWQELYEGLKGQTVYVDTSTTPSTWMRRFLQRVNEKGGAGDTEVPDDQKLWIESESSNFMQSYENPNPTKDPACKVIFFNMSNETIPAAFQSGDAKIVCCYAPSSSTCIKGGGVKVATSKTHMPDYIILNTWVASNDWLEENPDVAQRFINALVKASDWRTKNLPEASHMAEEVIEVQPDSINPDDCVPFDAQQLADGMVGFDKKEGTIYNMVSSLYNDKVGNVESGKVKALEESCNFSFMNQAIATFLGK